MRRDFLRLVADFVPTRRVTTPRLRQVRNNEARERIYLTKFSRNP